MTELNARSRHNSALPHFLARALVFVALSSSASAQIPSSISIESAQNPSPVGQGVLFTARVTSGQLRYNAAIGVGAGSVSSYNVRFELSGAKFKAGVANNALTNVTTPAAFTSVAVVTGGAVGQSWVVFQVTTGGTGVALTDQIRFSFVPDELSAGNTVVHSVHDTLSSATGDVSSNTAQVLRADPQTFATVGVPFAIGGTVTFASNGVNVAGCTSLALGSVPVQTCVISFSTAGINNVTASYSGDVNYAASAMTLAGGQRVIVDFTPTTLPDAVVGTPYSATLTGVGGTAPYTFGLESGNLPPGLTLAPTGVVSGTPTRSAGFEFTIRMTDVNGNGNSRSTTLAVQRGTQSIQFDPPTSAIVGTSIAVPLVTSVGLVIVYSIDTPTVCALSGASLRFLAPGYCRLVATQIGDSNYLATSSSPRTIQVTVAGGVQPLRLRSNADAQSLVLTLPSSQLVQSSVADPGPQFRVLGFIDIDGNRTLDTIFVNTSQGDLGDVRVWPDGNPGADRLLRAVRLQWRVDAVGDLDGDGFGDIVWRFTGQTPNPDDSGVSYVWFSNGNGVSQVRKRGGAPLNWTLLGALDLNGDGAADMVYISPTNEIRVLMATPQRTCANFAAGTIPAGFSALKLASFTNAGNGEIFARNPITGETAMIRLDARSVSLPAPSANPDDPNASCTAATATVNNTRLPWSASPAGLTFFGTADFNGDGLADIVWIRPDRSTLVWLSQGSGQPYISLDGTGSIPIGFSPVQP